MPDIIVCRSANIPAPERQSGLTALQCLALALLPAVFGENMGGLSRYARLIAAQDQRFVWRVQVKPDDIPKLRFKSLVIGDLERAFDVWLDSVGLLNSSHRVARDTPLALAMLLVDHCVRPAGGRTASLMIAALISDGTEDLRPERGASTKPAIPEIRKRVSHRLTTVRRTPTT